MRFYLIIFIVVAFVSCSKDETSEKMMASVPGDPITFAFSVKAKNGNDLLNPQIPQTLNTDKIRIFEVLNNEVIEIFDPMLDNPRVYTIHKDLSSGIYYMTHSLREGNDLIRKGYIQWNENDTDTIEVQLIQDRGIKFLKKIWYNEEKMWDRDSMLIKDMPLKPFEIIK